MGIKYNPSLKSNSFIIKIPLSNRKTDKLRVVVSTKISKKAIVRNRLRRQIKEAWRLLKITKIPAPHIYVKKIALDKSYQEIARELKNILGRYL